MANNETTMSYRCKVCCHTVDVPTESAVLDAMNDLGFVGEITLKLLCPSCGQKQFTSYRTGDGTKGIDNQER